MTVAELYNVLEKAIDSGDATLNSNIYFMKGLLHYAPDIEPINFSKVDSEGDLILSRYFSEIGYIK